MERENVRPVEERKMDKPGDNPSSEAENRLQTLLTYQEGEMKSPFCNWGESRMKAHVSNRQLTALFLFPIIYSKGRSHGLAHGQIMTYSIQFPLVTNHHMRTHNSCVCPCQGINLVLNNNHILKGQCPDYAHARASSVFSNWLDKISFRTAPPTEICCLYSQVIF